MGVPLGRRVDEMVRDQSHMFVSENAGEHGTPATGNAGGRSARFALYLRSVRTGQGAEQVACILAAGLAAKGHAIDFLIEDPEGALLDSLPENVSIVHLTASKTERLRDTITLWASFIRNCLAAPGSGRLEFLTALGRFLFGRRPPLRALRRYIARQQPVAILGMLNHPCLSLLLAAQTGVGKTHVLVAIHNNLSKSVVEAKSKRMQELPLLMRHLYPRADRVIAVSDGVRQDAQSCTGVDARQIKTIFNPIFRPGLAELAAERPAHAWFDPDDPCPVVLGVGKLKPQKDFETLLAAFAKVLRQRRARLIILGEGDGRSQLQATAAALGIADSVDLPGHVSNPYAFLASSSVFVLSSAWEGLPTVVIEALACGCPVVSTDCPSGPREILDGGRFGKLVPVGDAEGIARAIVETLDDPPPRAPLIERAGMFNLEDSVAAYEAVMMDPNA